MSWQAMTAVSRHSKQDGQLFRLILHLAEFADAGGNVDPAPNQETLAAHFGCTKRTIRNRLNDLESANELKQTRIGSGPGNPSAYRILLPMPETAVTEEPKAETKGGKAEKAETNTGFISAFQQEMAEIKAEILSLKAEILSLKAETKGGKGGKGGNERRKAHSTKSAHDPYLDPSLDPEEERGIPPLPPQKQRLAEMVNALAEVTVMDGHANWGILSQTAVELLGVYTAEQVRLHYSLEANPNGHWNWYLHDWRGQKNDPPRPKEVRETIKKAVKGIIPAPPKAAAAGGKPTAADSYAQVFGGS